MPVVILVVADIFIIAEAERVKYKHNKLIPVCVDN